MKRGLIGLQLSLGRPSTKHLLNPSQGLTGTLLGISTFDNGIFYYNSLMETLAQRTFPQFRSIIPCEVLLYIEVTFLGFIH